MSRFLVAPLVALCMIACVEPPTEADAFALAAAEAAAENAAPAEPGNRRALVITTTTLIPGDQLTITVTGANPNEEILIARSSAGLGAGPCLGSAGLLCLDITGVALHGSVFADANGTGVLVQTLPEMVPIGMDLWFQAVVPRGASGASWIKSTVLPVQTENAAITVANMLAGDLVITEMMMNPAAVADADGEWFEILNATTSDMNLDGLLITDFVGDSHTVTGTTFLAAGDFAVLGRNADPGTNGGVVLDYAYSNVDLGNGADEIHLLANGTFVDSVAWDGGPSFPTPVGASIELGYFHMNATDNDAGANWDAAILPFGLGDLGTPGTGWGEQGQWFYSIDQTADTLRRVDMATGVWEDVGALGVNFSYGDLAYDYATATVYMVDGRGGTDALYTVDLATGVATQVGVHGVTDMFGLAFDPRTDTLYGGAMDPLEWGLHALDTTTGAATYLGNPGVDLDALTFDANRGVLVNLTAGGGDLYEIDPGLLTSTLLYAGPFVNNCGLGYDPTADQFYAIDVSGYLFSYDPNNGYTQTTEQSGLGSHDGMVHVPFAP